MHLQTVWKQTLKLFTHINVCLFFSLIFVSVYVQAAEVERQLSTQVHSLRDNFREKSMSTSQHMTRLETLQAEVSHYQCHFTHFRQM